MGRKGTHSRSDRQRNHSGISGCLNDAWIPLASTVVPLILVVDSGHPPTLLTECSLLSHTAVFTPRPPFSAVLARREGRKDDPSPAEQAVRGC